MWVSPNHPNPPKQAGPPEDSGQDLATIRRGDGHEMRLRLKTYEGKPYVMAQLWTAKRGEPAWPVKGRSVTFRMGELSAVIDGLQAALGAAGEMSRQQDRARPQREDWRAKPMPGRQEEGGTFDEFSA